MLRRWIIRGLALALLTLCLVAWAESYLECTFVGHWSKTYEWEVGVVGGDLEWSDEYHNPGGSRGWTVRYLGRYEAASWAWHQSEYATTPYRILGFIWKPRTSLRDCQYILIPLWFPTTLSAGILWLVWRKTHLKYNGKGFPVEVGDQQIKP